MCWLPQTIVVSLLEQSHFPFSFILSSVSLARLSGALVCHHLSWYMIIALEICLLDTITPSPSVLTRPLVLLNLHTSAENHLLRSRSRRRCNTRCVRCDGWR